MNPTENSESPAAPASELLFGTAANEIPPRARAGFLKARDGLRLRYALFAAGGRPRKGTVVILTGRNESIEKYFETIRDLSVRGLGTAIMDLRGQGGSERQLRDPERGYVNSFQDYVADLDQFFEEIVLPDCPGPFYILAHSTGSLIALLAAPGLVNRVRRMVLSAPLLSFGNSPVSMVTLQRITVVLYNLGLGSMYLGGGPRSAGESLFATNKLTSDFLRYTRNAGIYLREPKLALGGPTVTWLLAACRAVARVSDPDFMARIQVPSLLIAAGADEVVSTPAIEEYAYALKSGSLLTIDGARHEMLQEADVYREQFLAAFDSFVPGTDVL